MGAFSPVQILEDAHKAGASDIHLLAGERPMVRIDGVLRVLYDRKLSQGDLEDFVKESLGEDVFARFEKEREADGSLEFATGLRLRLNCHYAQGAIGVVGRIIPKDIPTLEEVGLGQELSWLPSLRTGLMLVTGPTGSGKSTLLAALIRHIVETSPEHIVTLEDPIEFELPQGIGLVRQRQFGQDFITFGEGLRRVLRQDPNIILIGEMRDPETIGAALTLAETGHLVLATLHTPNAIQTVDRIIDVFPPYQQPQVRSQLSLSLKVVIAQRLLPKVGGGRVAQREVLVNTSAVSNIIRDARTPELRSVMQTGQAQGMLPFEKDAERLLKLGHIDQETYDWVIKLL
jgi:twitching motility protein PilT